MTPCLVLRYKDNSARLSKDGSYEMEVKEVIRPATPRPNAETPGINKIGTNEGLGDGSNDDFRGGEKRRWTRIAGSTKATERGANILWVTLTLYELVITVFGFPLEVGEGPPEVVDGEGTSGISCVAQASKYVFVTPAPLAFGPD